ncbi:DUF2834 domain-containing protein [Cryobacterium melibiosiphilum]|uniref:DUF2834 domain-containing protein n=1 Tax=Cryobacterium melibiosiphilum TaxID=995039 RepID=A0A3A5MGZ6_9MICO|nr:DUF2834 domain-containing protein [Cryobacterium melibiosiphilum]RJT88645.1 DUF2834 domain-containing protein [Cryobacterium melibiosiphilum]RJT89407.1 DUF2834 domain-containing protein [Cryobacterium melibiosiphilum]
MSIQSPRVLPRVPLHAHWTPLAVTYLVLSVIGLIGTWTYNVIAILERRDYLGDWVGSGPSVSSLTVDLLIAAIAGSVFIIVEARRLGMRRGWLYVVLSGVTAFACMFPLFLCMRERTLAARRAGAENAPQETST